MNRIRTMLARAAAPEAAPPWTGSSALLTVAFAFIAMFVGTAVAFVWLGEQDYTQLLGLTLGGILIILFVWQTRRSDLAALRLQPSSSPLFFVMFISLGFAITLDLISLAVTREFVPVPVLLGLSPGALTAVHWLLLVVFLVVVQPIAEGLIFRAVALPSLRAMLGSWGGIIGVAALASVFHFALYPPNYNTTSTITPIWFGLVVPLIEALFYNLVRGYTGSTRAAIAANVAFGIFAVLKFLAIAGQSG